MLSVEQEREFRECLSFVVGTVMQEWPYADRIMAAIDQLQAALEDNTFGEYILGRHATTMEIDLGDFIGPSN